MHNSHTMNRFGRFGVLAALVALLSLGSAAALLAGDKNKDKKKSEKAYLGVYMQTLNSEVREGLDIKVDKGVLINGVADDSPAEKAGIEDGDVVIMFDGKAVEDTDDLGRLVSKATPGAVVKVKAIRDGKEMDFSVTMSERPNGYWIGSADDAYDWNDFKHFGRRTGDTVFEFARNLGGPRLGIHGWEMETDLATYFNSPAGEGVLVLSVDEETVAESAGVQAGDVIQKINDTAVSSTDELRDAIKDLDEGDTFKIDILRKGKKQQLTATMDGTANRVSFFSPDGTYRMHNPHRYRAPRVRVERIDDDLREELDDVRKELDAIKKELREQRR